MVLVLASRWGLEPVVVATAISRDERSPLPAKDDTTSSDRSTTATTAAATAEPLAEATTTTAAVGPPAAQSSDLAGEEEDDELTGRTLWDCAQVLWDLVADPHPDNEFAVRGKHVIELGGGTGALSVGLARAGAASVTCTDLPCHLARIKATVCDNSRATRSASVPSGSSSSDCSGGGNGLGGGGDGDDGSSFWTGVPYQGRGPVATAAAAAVVAREARVCVAALRWGDEEDFTRMRATPNGGAGEGRRANGNQRNGGSSSCRSTDGKEAYNKGNGSSGVGSSPCNLCSSSAVLGVGDDAKVATTIVPQGGSDDETVTAATLAVRVPIGIRSTESEQHPGRQPRGTEECRRNSDDSTEREAAVAGVLGDTPSPAGFDVIVLSEVLYWPALDLLKEDTREPLLRTLVGLSKPGTKVILIYKQRWPQREQEFLTSCEGSFRVEDIPASLLALPEDTGEEPGSAAIRAVVMVRLSMRSDEEKR